MIRDEAGKIVGVRYDELAPMLLNEVQQQRNQIQEMKRQLVELKQINQAMQAAVAKLQSEEARVAMR